MESIQTFKRLKILSYNIHKGFSLGNRRYILDLIRQSIRSVDADIVFLQEIIGKHDLPDHHKLIWPKNSQFEYLADGVWHHYAYGKNAVYKSGDHGNAILSRYPIKKWDNFDISTNNFEKRGLLHAVIGVENSPPVHLISLHLDLFENGRTSQVEKICHHVENLIPQNEKLILAGDFNDWREKITNKLENRLKLQEVFQKLYGKHCKTFPSFFPVLCLDRIYVRNINIQSGKVLHGEPWNKLSDHLAIFAEINID